MHEGNDSGDHEQFVRKFINGNGASNSNGSSRHEIFKIQEDPRVFSFGSFIRRTSIDEFPQLINVLRGEMSLVGTRPPTGDEISHYSEHHWQRLYVKPGLTGEWQVNGRSHIKDFEQVFELDLQYQTKWHQYYDLSLIIKTIYVIFARIGAF